MHEVSKELSILPVYPVHGGYLGRNAKKLAYGKYSFYDTLSPQFNTYDVIKELMRHNN